MNFIYHIFCEYIERNTYQLFENFIDFEFLHFHFNKSFNSDFPQLTLKRKINRKAIQ